MRTRNLLLDEVIRHFLGRAKRRYPSSCQHLNSFRSWWQSSGRRIRAPAICFFQRVTQKRVVAALGRNQRSQTWGERKSDAAFADVVNQLVTFFRMVRQLIEEFHEFLIRQRRSVLKFRGLWKWIVGLRNDQ